MKSEICRVGLQRGNMGSTKNMWDHFSLEQQIRSFHCIIKI